MNPAEAGQIVQHNRRFHNAPGYAEAYDRHCGIMAHWWERAIFRRDVRAIARRLGPLEGKCVLDIGCGTGSLSLLFLEEGFAVLGLDLAPSMLDRLRAKAEQRGLAERLRTSAVPADEFLADDGESFDAIAFSATLHHVPDYVHSLRLAAGRLAPGGLVYIILEPSLKSRVGRAAKALEWLDRSLAEGTGFVRRQLGEAWREGPITALRNKLRRRRERRAARNRPGPGNRQGVDLRLVDVHTHTGCDERAIAQALRDAGLRVDLTLYDTKRHLPFHLLASLLRTRRMIRVMAARDT